MAPLSTQDVARKAGISRVTLERWLASGTLSRPNTIRVGHRSFRDWTIRDVARVRKHKQENYRKGRGRKPKRKRQ